MEKLVTQYKVCSLLNVPSLFTKRFTITNLPQNTLNEGAFLPTYSHLINAAEQTEHISYAVFHL